jgi:hypothetical protein
MNPHFNKMFIIVLLSSFFFAYCGSDSEVTPTPTPDPEPMETLPVATISHDIPATITEGAQSYTVTVTLDKAATSTLSIPVTFSSGTASSGSDFEFGSNINISSGSMTGSLPISFFGDCEIEGAETLSIMVGNSSATDVTITAQTISTSIEDAAGDELTLTFDWAGFTIFEGDTLQFCDFVDIDFYLIDSSLTTFIDGVEAITEDCPEVLTLSPANVDDGIYYILSFLYFNGFDSTFTHSYPISVNANKCGGFDETFIQNESFQYTASSKDFFNDEEEVETLSFVAGLIVQGGIYALVDLETAEIIVEGIRPKLSGSEMQRIAEMRPIRR